MSSTFSERLDLKIIMKRGEKGGKKKEEKDWGGEGGDPERKSDIHL